MEYSGKLYGKVNGIYFPLESTTEDFDSLQKNIEILNKKLRIAQKALDDIVRFDDNLNNKFGDTSNCANIALEKMILIDLENKNFN